MDLPTVSQRGPWVRQPENRLYLLYGRAFRHWVQYNKAKRRLRAMPWAPHTDTPLPTEESAIGRSRSRRRADSQGSGQRGFLPRT